VSCDIASSCNIFLFVDSICRSWRATSYRKGRSTAWYLMHILPFQKKHQLILGQKSCAAVDQFCQSKIALIILSQQL
jgi:hypothetical protein